MLTNVLLNGPFPTRLLDKQAHWFAIKFVVLCAPRRGVAQLGSALAWGARGRGFKSRRPDQSVIKSPLSLKKSINQ